MSRHTSFLTALLLASVFTRAETTGGQSEDVKALLQRIDQLEQRVAELEAGKNTSTAHLQDLKAQDTQIPTGQTVEEHLSTQMHDEHSQNVRDVEGHFPSMQLRGFGDVDFSATDERGTTSGFTLGQFVLHVASPLSKKVAYFGELSFTAQPTSYTADVERSIIRYSYNDHFKLSFGRYHTPINYWNTAFHHGTWFQTATGRPLLFFFEDGGGPLPVHNVGMSLTGTVPSGKLDLHYIAEIGNGRPARTPQNTTVQNSQDENNGKSFNLGFYARPDWASGLQFGASVYYDHLIPNALTRVHEYIPAVHIVYITPKFEFMNEGVWIRHQVDNGGRVYNSPGFYTQISRQWAKYRPYFRYQYVNISATEPVLADIGRQDGPSVGLRYEWSDFAAFKIQYDRNYRRGFQDYDSVSGQMAFTF